MNGTIQGHGRCSLFTTKLVAYLREHSGTQATDEELETVIGMPTGPHKRGYGFLLSAIKQLERERIVWRRIPQARAIKRFTEFDELQSLAKASRRHISKTAKRAIRVADAVDLGKLNADERKQFMSEGAQISALAWISSSAATRQIAARTPAAQVDQRKLLESLTNS